jgi:UPF0755 protein
MKKITVVLFFLCAIIGAWFVYSEIFTAEAVLAERVTFEVAQGESVGVLADRLADEQVIRHAWLFKKYVAWKGVDKNIRFGTFEVAAPVTLARVVEVLNNPSVGERTIMILPGWSLRDIEEYIREQQIGAPGEDLFEIAGRPAYDYRSGGAPAPVFVGEYRVLDGKPSYVSFEGYLAPDTYRIYEDATLEEMIEKLIAERDLQFTEEMYRDIERSGRTVYEVITMASIVEREVRTTESRKKVADIFWRRYDMNWALQADSTVHYVVGKNGSVFTTREDRASLSPWNTYKYPGLPLGPISNPSLDAILATIYPEPNDDWYFLTTDEGEVKYAKTIEQHNANVSAYLR